MESGRVPEAGLLPAPPAQVEARPAKAEKLERFGRYYLLERIGVGGMAEVYRAVTQGVEGFRRMFVVKRILAEKSRSPTFIQMFCEEARISALLHHPNIVQVYDFGHVAGSYFLAMEYLLGKDLASVMRVLRGSNLALPPGMAAFIAQQVALGLGYAHGLRGSNGQPMGIVHRDVTPSNIMLLHAGGVKILDFGIAKAGEAASGEEAGGAVKGKLRYLAPEQVRLEPVDARADVFALGITLWEMLAGKRLFAGENELETLQNVLQKPVPPPSAVRPGVPAELDRVVLRALERDPERRYKSAEHMANDLEEILREARYESQSLRRLLRELFGEESSSRSLEMPDLPEEAEGTPQPAARIPSVEIEFVEGSHPRPVAATVPRSRSVAPPFGVATTSTAPLLPEVRRAAALRRVGAAAALLLLLGGAAALAYTLRGKSAPPALVVAATPAAQPAAVPPPAPRAPARVKISFASNPPGASVLGGGGQPLGVTPFSIEMPRSDTRQIFTFAKAGWQSATYEAAPDRDVAAMIELQRIHSAPSRRTKRAPAARTLGDGMTINPF